MRSVLKICLLAFATLGLVACYHPDIQQGNDYAAADIKKLKLGMSREDVIQIMGSPLLTPNFNQSQLIYVYYYYPNHGHITQQHATLYFKNSKLSAIKNAG